VVDSAAFVFAQGRLDESERRELAFRPGGPGVSRDNVVFEGPACSAGPWNAPTFILHERREAPTDLPGLTPIRYPETMTPAQVRSSTRSSGKAIENEGPVPCIDGLWWQYSLTEHGAREPSS
jgi:hypothetical protein